MSELVNKLTKGLNDKQKQAVMTTNGPLLVMASAGSGKTRVLTRRIVYLIKVNHVRSSSILALTFTNKAKDEMKSRITKLIGPNDVVIETFHSLCKNILYLIPFFKDFAIANDTITKNVSQQAVDSTLKYHVKKAVREHYAHVISKQKHRSILPNEALHKAVKDGFADKRPAEIYQRYEHALGHNHLFDFDDLLMYVSWAFDEYPQFLRAWQSQFKYVLVDEFQDTDDIQFKLLRQLANPEFNLFAVGDVNQSIYSWRGARPQYIMKFRRYCPKEHLPKIIYMNRNYRSTQNVVNGAESIISYNYFKAHRPNRSYTLNPTGAKIEYYRADDMTGSLDYLAERMKKLHDDKGYKYTGKDMAVICRQKQQINNVFKGLHDRKIPCCKEEDDDFLKNKLVNQIINYLYVIINPDNVYSLSVVFKTAKMGIGATTFKRLEQYSRFYRKKHHSAILGALGHIYNCNGISKKRKAVLNKFGHQLRMWRKYSQSHGVYDLLKSVVKINHIHPHKKKDKTYFFRLLNRAKLFDKLYKPNRQGRSLSFLNSLSLDNQKEQTGHGVPLMTVHSSKGREFKNVFIAGLNDKVFPSEQAIHEDKMQEERRLFYVALTRAKERLYLTSAHMASIFGGEHARLSNSDFYDESRFIDEIDNKYLHVVKDFKKPTKSKQLRKLEKSIAEANHKYKKSKNGKDKIL